MQFSAGFKRYFTNTGWLLFDRIFRVVILGVVGICLARYLGPSKYGLLSYATSFVFLLSAIATLGLDRVVVRDLVSGEEKRDQLLGTAFFLKGTGGLLLLGILAIAVRFTNNTGSTNVLIFIIASAWIFQSFNVIDSYFRSRVLAKYAVYARTASVVVAAIATLSFIFAKTGLIYFAVVILIENVILAAGLIVAYAKQRLSIFSWRTKFALTKSLLKDSWPLIFTGVALSIHARIDQVMIKEMLGAEQVGHYAVAVKLSEIWYFIPAAITSSVFPAVVNAKRKSLELYHQRLERLYVLMTWLGIGVALPMTFLAYDIVNLLFGTEYVEAASPLKIYIWAGVFASLGPASGLYLISENLTRIIFLRAVIGVAVNIALNILLIPKYGINGAAIATLLSYSCATFFIGFIPTTRSQALLMLKSVDLFSVLATTKETLRSFRESQSAGS